MLANIIIKTEPLDIEETKLMEPHFNSNIKVELDDDVISTGACDNLKFSGERQIINNVNDLKYQFLQEQQKNINCENYYMDRFYNTNISNYFDCTSEQSCSVCYKVFRNVHLLLKHLSCHRENYFFCKYQHCGDNFKSLSDCEMHENIEHTYKSNQNKKITSDQSTSKYACSFCRYHFKTELQLHVHWLNNDNSCGKLMQQVIKQYNNVLADKSKNNVTNIQMPILPTTKLRLKTPIDHKIPYSSTLKRPHQSHDHEMAKTKCTNDELKSLRIKQMPLGKEEVSYAHMHQQNWLPNVLFPEVIIKTESDNDDIDNVKNLNEDLKHDINSEMKLQTDSLFIENPLISKNIKLQNENCLSKLNIVKSNKHTSNVPVLQPLSLSSQITSKVENEGNTNFKNINNIKLLSMAPNEVQIIKLPPSTRLVKLPAKQGQIVNKTNTIKKSETELKSNSINVQVVPQKLTMSNHNNFVVKQTSMPMQKLTTTIDLIDGRNMLMVERNADNNANLVNDVQRNVALSKENLKAIENLPKNKQIIKSMIEQIKLVESKSPGNSKTVNVENFPQFQSNITNPKAPPSVYVPLYSLTDLDLIQARRAHKEYKYCFICPYCQQQYELKTTVRTHLIEAHNLKYTDLVKMCVEAKPLLDVNQDNVLCDINHDNGYSNDLQISNNNDYQIESNNVSNVETQKKGYRCDKCDRYCSSKTLLNDHILANCSRNPRYSCTRCRKKFQTSSTLQCHMTIHTGELPHKCLYCEKRFRTRGQVTVHHRTHTGERPFVCQVCSVGFTHRETLIYHLSRHIGMKRYKCYGCDKQFSCISALKTHRETRPNTCGQVKFNARALGPRIRVVRGNVIFEPQPKFNAHLRSEDPKEILVNLANNSVKSNVNQSN